MYFMSTFQFFQTPKEFQLLQTAFTLSEKPHHRELPADFTSDKSNKIKSMC